MKQLNIHGPGRVQLDELPEPSPGPRDAVVRVAACGVCGTDLRYVRMGGLRRPMPLGHELAGTVEAVGAEVTDLRTGTRVVLNPTAAGNMIGNGGKEGGFAPKLLVRNAADGDCLFEVPEALPMTVAALAEPIGVGMNAVDRTAVVPEDKVAVFGAGPIGLATLACLRDRGVHDVVAVDLSARRLEIAKTFGARACIQARKDDVWARLRELHGSAPLMAAPMAGTDAYIEASGAAQVIKDVIQNAKTDARLTIVALHEKAVEVGFLWVMMKQLTIRGAMEYPRDFAQSLALLGRWDLSAMITHHFPLDRFEDALRVAQDPSLGGKVMIDIEEEN